MRGNERLGGEVGAHRRETVEAFPAQPVGPDRRTVFPPGQIPTRHVVRGHIARDVVAYSFRRNVPAPAADHDRQLGLPIDPAHAWRQDYVIECAGHGAGLGEEIGPQRSVGGAGCGQGARKRLRHPGGSGAKIRRRAYFAAA